LNHTRAFLRAHAALAARRVLRILLAHYYIWAAVGALLPHARSCGCAHSAAGTGRYLYFSTNTLHQAHRAHRVVPTRPRQAAIYALRVQPPASERLQTLVHLRTHARAFIPHARASHSPVRARATPFAPTARVAASRLKLHAAPLNARVLARCVLYI